MRLIVLGSEEIAVPMSYTEDAVVEGEASKIGRDPRSMTIDELNALGHMGGSILRAVRQNCIDCCGGMKAEVRRCRIVKCPMWTYRMGKNPFLKRRMSEAAKKVLADRMASARKTINRKR